MANTIRESNLFAAENWTKVYETFRDIDFQSYDFQTIRRSMIEYLQTFYPEDFNDFIESSEYVALIDLIAYLGQSLSFRTDLNARENFLETAERRDSILRLAKMLNYHPKRNQIARGLLKVTSVSTTEPVFDSNGNNLQDTEIFWGDVNNPDFLEQFTTIVNAALVSEQRYGNPALRTVIGGTTTEEYNVNITPNTVPVYQFSSSVGGRDFSFEIVTGTYSGRSYLYERAPQPSSTTSLIYRRDGLGYNSVNNGFFVYFKQGSLQTVDFAISEKLPNRVVQVDVANIDNNDVWLYKLDTNGRETEQWTKLPAISGTNVIYNSLSKEVKTLFSVNGRENDQIELVFGDDIFADSPVGDYRVYFRTGVGLTYKIAPADMQDIEIAVPYVSHTRQLETITLRLSLQQTVSNGTARQSLAEIKVKAPQQYYTQDRMVTGEDYQIFPFTTYNNIVKSKAVNRTVSGISRYLDVRDTTGKYSSTNIVAEDGVLYREEPIKTFNFTFTTTSDIANVISRQIEPVNQNNESLHFYYKNYSSIDVSDLSVTWNRTIQGTGSCNGYFKNISNAPQTIGTYTSSNMKYVKTGSLIKFLPPAGYVFGNNNALVLSSLGLQNTKNYLWASVTQVVTDGTNQGEGNLDDGTGPVTLSEVIPSGAILDRVIAPWNNVFLSDFRSSLITAITQYKTFGIRYDRDTQQWVLITALDLDQRNTFSLDNAGDTSSSGRDNSWFWKFTNDGATYTVSYRSTAYYFESVLETRFYFDPDLTIFDPVTGKTVQDRINILKSNTLPDSSSNLGINYVLNVDDSVVETDGYTLTEKVKVTFPDTDKDGVVDDPEVFDIIVAPTVNSATKVVFYKSYLDNSGFIRYQPIVDGSIDTNYSTVAELRTSLAAYESGQLFYTSSSKQFWVLSINTSGTKIVTETTDYTTEIGRSNLLFQYTHNAPNNRRIDPSPSNIIDLFLLTTQYDTDFRNWITDVSGKVSKPARPSTTELRDSFGSLESYKSVSDAIIFHSVNYRPLFGDKADANLQATFKIVKNTSTLVTDNEIKARVVNAINEYFNIANWDFGDTFYFSELDSYLHTVLAPDILSVIIVPKSGSSSFGSLYQIQSQRDEIFISSATVNDIEIIDVITATTLRASGTVVNQTTNTLVTESVSASATGSSTTVNTVTNSITRGTTTLSGYDY